MSLFQGYNNLENIQFVYISMDGTLKVMEADRHGLRGKKVN